MSGSDETNHVLFELPQIPDTWQWTTLGEIADIVSGVTKGQRHSDKTSLREVPYLRVANVQRGFLDLSEIKSIRTTEEKIETLRLKTGDVLLNEGGDRDKLGRGWVWNGEIDDCIHQNHVFRARLPEGVNPKFISFYANFFGRDWFWRHATQSINLASINQTILRQFPVPIAPTKEQDRIVAKIEELFSDVDASVAALERAKANLERYRASVLKAAVAGCLTEEWRSAYPDVEPASKLLERILAERRRRWESEKLAEYEAKGKKPPNDWNKKYPVPAPPAELVVDMPSIWTTASLEQITTADRVICYGILMPKDHTPDGVPYVKVRDMRGDRISLKYLNHTSPAIAAKYSRSSLAPGDILLSIRGTYGRVAEVPEELAGGNITQDSARLDVTPAVNRRFVAWCLRSPVLQNYFERVARGVAVKGVNIRDVRPCPIPLPSRPEQDVVVVEIDRLFSIVEQAEAFTSSGLTKTVRLRQSILESAYEGTLLEQLPSDEPASQLLKRLRRERAVEMTKPKPARRPKERGRPKVKNERRQLRDVIQNHPDGTAPDVVFSEAGLDRENLTDIDSFFEELGELVSKRQVVVERPDSATVLIRPRSK